MNVAQSPKLGPFSGLDDPTIIDCRSRQVLQVLNRGERKQTDEEEAVDGPEGLYRLPVLSWNLSHPRKTPWREPDEIAQATY